MRIDIPLREEGETQSHPAILDRLQDLISQGSGLRIGYDRDGAIEASDGMVSDDIQYEQCHAWITASRSVVLLLSDMNSVYVEHVERIAKEQWGLTINRAVGQISAVLSHLRVDLEKGLLTSITNVTRAEIFDDFLDHARAYLEKDQKNQAGVISGVVFEDTIRRIANDHGIEEAGNPLDQLISALSHQRIISGVMAKRAKAAAGLRTQATHAQWTEFETWDVEATIAVTDELILKHLNG